jgi:mxaK protein
LDVRRAHGHLAFGVLALAVTLVTGAQIVRLVHAEEIDAAIVNVTKVGDLTRIVEKEESTRPPGMLPEARLTRAVELSKSDYDGALSVYKSIVQSGREDLRRAALYDLGNLHLEHALQMSDEAQSLPLIELAKQSYREELRRDPNDWDARYNLERALRLAPEEDEDLEDNEPPPRKERERSTIADPRLDLP